MNSSTMTGETGSRTVESLAHRHPTLVAVARLGWIAKGVVYVLLGLLAIPIALNGVDDGQARNSGEEASQLGAVAEIAETSFGVVALWAVAFGLALYIAWRVVTILLPAENTAKAWVTRIGYLVSALVYAALAWTAMSFAQGADSTQRGQSEDAKVERFSRDLMEKSGGRWLVGAIGAVVIVVGLYFVVRGLMAKFRDELEPGDVGPFRHEWIVTLGRIGWVGRGIVMLLVGWFLVRAAVRFRPEEAEGIDNALRNVTGSTAGALLVGVVAVAVIVYGAFCVISAPRQKLTSAD